MRRHNSLRGCIYATIALTIVSLFLVACGEEEEPLGTGQWKESGPLPADFVTADVAAGPDGSAYIGGYEPAEYPYYTQGLVYRWTGSRWVEAFRAPMLGSYIETIAGAGGAIWAGGNIWPELGRTQAPYLIRYAGGEWEEIDVPAYVQGPRIHTCCPVDKDFCWFIVWATGGGHAIYSFNHGIWKRHLTEESGNLGFFLAVTPGGKAFVINGRDYGGGFVSLLVTDDRGASWHREAFALPPDWRIRGSEPTMEAVGENLYLSFTAGRYNQMTGRYESNETVIFRRDQSPAGNGIYEEVFSSGITSEFEVDLDCLAFKSAAEGYAAGSKLGARYTGGEWRMENLIGGDSDLAIRHIAASPQKYWALGYSHGRYGLYQSP